MDEELLDTLKRLARAIAAQFGPNCEVVVHDLTGGDPENTIALIENGHVSNRSVGRGSSHIALEAIKAIKAEKPLADHYDYLTKTADGRILRSGTVYINDSSGKPAGIFSINFDLTPLMMAKSALDSLVRSENGSGEPERIPTNVNELLDDLLERSVQLIGKPVAMMNKDDKVRAIRYLNDAGAMLITRSGDKIASYFSISKYTLYSYLDSGGKS
ncbi:MAG TPA: helix-turn-helix transcriptional regulator [Clostridia bacterium]|nr:MAG: YheO-like PAS domain protein [Firmicutes bacterium ADurb.Bin248]HOG01547.1 helix-turn-helix transcriptional regulator [Clostridia bacterium]HOS18168.1 helix-turn-helix transcriptional regulator [Clostridia bacterium]